MSSPLAGILQAFPSAAPPAKAVSYPGDINAMIPVIACYGDNPDAE